MVKLSHTPDLLWFSPQRTLALAVLPGGFVFGLMLGGV